MAWLNSIAGKLVNQPLRSENTATNARVLYGLPKAPLSIHPVRHAIDQTTSPPGLLLAGQNGFERFEQLFLQDYLPTFGLAFALAIIPRTIASAYFHTPVWGIVPDV